MHIKRAFYIFTCSVSRNKYIIYNVGNKYIIVSARWCHKEHSTRFTILLLLRFRSARVRSIMCSSEHLLFYNFCCNRQKSTKKKKYTKFYNHLFRATLSHIHSVIDNNRTRLAVRIPNLYTYSRYYVIIVARELVCEAQRQ